jgi:hypothetical protein
MRRVGLTLVAFGLLAGCAARWPEENRAEFTRSCLANARKTKPTAPEDALAAYCDCAATRLQERYSLEEFTAIEARSVRENKPALELVQVVEDCAGRLR